MLFDTVVFVFDDVLLLVPELLDTVVFIIEDSLLFGVLSLGMLFMAIQDIITLNDNQINNITIVILNIDTILPSAAILIYCY